jgi:hypothetical protein
MAVNREHGEWRDGGVPQKEPHFLPLVHRFGHVDGKIRIDTMPVLDVDDHTSRPPLSCSSPAGADRESSGSTGRSKGQSP